MPFFFAALMQQKISMKVDTSAIEQEIANYEKQLRQSYSIKYRLIEEIDTLDPDDKHYIKRKADLDDRLYKMYDKIEDTESLLIEARAKKTAIEAEKLTADNSDEILQALRQGHIAYVINTIDINAGDSHSDGSEIRRAAVENNVTMFTSLDTVKVLLDVLEEITLGVSTIDAE